MSACPLCHPQSESVLYQNDVARVILVTDQSLVPVYCRVIVQKHVAEMTDLTPAMRQMVMDMVYKVETAMRLVLKPKKINLASFGTMVPHQHWHIIARFEDDAYYPDSIWSNAHHPSPPSLPEHWLTDFQQSLLQQFKE